jgi:hypothetical protein
VKGMGLNIDECNDHVFVQSWVVNNSHDKQGTLGNMQIRLYTKQCVNLTLKIVDLYRNWTRFKCNTFTVDLTLENLLQRY